MVYQFTVKNIDQANVSILGYASVFNIIDHYNDIILAGAFKKSIKLHNKKNNIKFLWQHDYKNPIGIINLLSEDSYGLLIEGSINSSINKGKEAISLIRQGAINGLSVGFVSKDSGYNKNGYREIKEAELWEVSIVTFPANPNACINTIDQNSQLKTLALSIKDANYSIKKLIQIT